MDNPQEESGKMFVGGLSWESTQDDLCKYFSQFGEVVDCVVMKNPDTGRSRGFGFVTFKHPACVEIVLAGGSHVLDGRTIDPKACNPRSMQKSRKGDHPKIFLGGLPSNVTETDLRNSFSEYGKVVEVVIMFDQEKKRSRGFGFLSFDMEDSVNRVCALQYVIINGKQVECKKAQPRDGKSYGGGGGRQNNQWNGNDMGPRGQSSHGPSGGHGMGPPSGPPMPNGMPGAMGYPPAPGWGPPPSPQGCYPPQGAWIAPGPAYGMYGPHPSSPGYPGWGPSPYGPYPPPGAPYGPPAPAYGVYGYGYNWPQGSNAAPVQPPNAGSISADGSAPGNANGSHYSQQSTTDSSATSAQNQKGSTGNYHSSKYTSSRSYEGGSDGGYGSSGGGYGGKGDGGQSKGYKNGPQSGSGGRSGAHSQSYHPYRRQ